MSQESIFSARTLKDIHAEIKSVYLADNRPWIIGFSGGKDSTAVVQLVWNAISELPSDKRQKKIFVISSDTLVETPVIVNQITGTLEKIEKKAKEVGLLISTNLIRPVLEDRFWVNLLGRGYPAPSSKFRWCTDRLKINNADRFINEKVSQYGEAIVVLGTRKSESMSRQQLMNLYEIKGSLLSHHSKFPQTYVYTPIKDFITDDVWNYLLQNQSPWGNNNRDLVALYKSAQSGECPLVVDTSTPSCGNSRFGCWVCTVVEKDKSMENLIDSGEEWMEPLLELREILKETQDPEVKKKVRELKRRQGFISFKSDGSGNITRGPYTMEFCQDFLRKLLRTQLKIQKNGPEPNAELISQEELIEIQRIWRMERGDWKNSVHTIYEEETGSKLPESQEDLGMFGQVEQELLQQVSIKHKIPSMLVSKLLQVELESQGMSRHSAVYGKINKIISEEWRDEKEILEEHQQREDEKVRYE